jgi:hypothetical protein
MRYNKTKKVRGGSCDSGVCTLPQTGGANCRIGVLNPRYGGKRQKGAGCGCGSSKPLMNLPAGVTQGPLTLGLKGGSCGCGSAPPKPPSTSELLQNGGACPCQAVAAIPHPMGGYRPTKRNLKYLKKWKRGESIGFTMRSSLKAKGLIPRANGTKRVSNKYKK